MACCTTPSTEPMLRAIFAVSGQDINQWSELKIKCLNLKSHLPGAIELIQADGSTD